MATWQDDSSMYGSKQDVWDAIIEEQPLLQYSPIFQKGYDEWDMGGGIGQFIHNYAFAPPLDLINRIFTGHKLGGSASPWGTVRMQPDEPSTGPNWASVKGHAQGHQGWEYPNKLRALWNNLLGSDSPGTGGGEEQLQMMHDQLYQPDSGTAYWGRNRLLDKGYIEPTNIPGGIDYMDGYQYSPKGREFIKKSGVIPENKRAIGYYESSPTVNQSPVVNRPSERPTRPTMRDIAGPVTNLSRRGPSRAQQRLNTGGIASLWRT